MIELCDQVLQHLSDLNALSNKLKSRANKMKAALEPFLKQFSDEPEIELIEKSLNNILENPEPFQSTEELTLFQDDCWSIFNAIQIFSNSMVNYTSKRCRKIEKMLFNIVFIPGDDYNTRILPVYRAHDEFLTTESPISNFKSSTGSGKTRCAPFFFAIKAIQDNLERPFFIMTQPSSSIIRDKIADFTEILGDSVICIATYQELESMYDDLPKKPVVALFTPHTLVKILARARDRKFPLVEYSRFVLDEIHERSVDTDVLVALLAKSMKKISFPLQLLMMSATPDPRILESFDKVQKIEMPDTQLFPIKDIKKESKDFRELDSMVRDSTIDIINDMVDEKFKPGHILIFTSGNKRINNLMNMISSTFESKIAKEKKNARLLKKFDNFLTSQDLFYDHLEEVLLNDDDSDSALYFLIIKYAGFVSREAQEIGKNPIRGHPNVIKIIVATNSIESSITIDGLAAVIDSGICNTPNFDRTKGLTNLEEGPISTQSQTQRRGRVGRKRDGICVQFTIKNHPPIELRPPAIETEDISSNILSLRKIKINLEDIDNLPLPGVSQENMNDYMNELIKIGALDKSKKLTNVGSRLAAFSSLSPFVSSSILKVSDKYNDDSKVASIVGALAFLILSTNNIFVDAISDTFRRNFCEDSDILTLMSSIFEVMMDGKKKGSLRKRLSDSGFHPSNGVKLIGTVEQIASIIYDDDKKTLWNEIAEFYKSHDMMKFIQEIMTEIGQIRPDWVSCRQSQYVTVVNVLNNYNFIYKGDESLTENGSEPEIKMRMRPGGKGFASPGACFIMQFSCSDKNNYYGSIVHRDLSRDEICHPTIVETPLMMNNAFVVPIIEGYIGEHRKEFKPFQKTMVNTGSAHGGYICYPEQFGNSTIISYVSKEIDDDNVKKLMEEAIQKAQRIIPYTPRTILVKADVLKAIVAVTSFGTKNYTTQIINYTDKNPFPYSINKTTIDYLIEHIKELGDVDGHLVIAMTGEKFSYSSTAEDEDFIGNPVSYSSAPCVFGPKIDFYSHLVILSNKEIPNVKPLTWVDRKISVTYSDVDSLIHVSNQIFRGVVEVNHEFDEIYFIKPNSKVIVDGKRPEFQDTTQESDVFRPIGCMFDSFAMHCIKGTRIENNVDLKGFDLSENINIGDLKKDYLSVQAFKRQHRELNVFNIIKEISQMNIDQNELQNLYDQRKGHMDELNAARDEMKQLSNDYNKPGANKGQIRAQQAANKKKREQLQSIVDSINNRINQIKQPLINLCKHYNIDEKVIKPLMKVHTPEGILSQRLQVRDNYLSVNCRVDEREKILNEIKQYRSDLIPEIIPVCTITVSHRTNSNISKQVFIDKINDICKKFGAIIRNKEEYKENEKSHINKGFIKITLLTGEFAIPFAGEVQNEIGAGDKVILRIPTKIIPICLLSRPDVVEAIEKWIEEQGLELRKTGFKYAGSSQEIEKAMNLLANKETQPKIPYKSFTIPGGIDISKVMASINRKNSKLTQKSRWGINKTARLIYVPDDIEDDMVQEFINSVESKEKKKIDEEEETEIIYDYLFCCDDTAVLSGLQMPLYQEDGSARLYNYCVTCAYDLFKTEIEYLFDQEEDKPKMNLLIENTKKVKFIELFDDSTNDAFPQIPIGQMLWCLVSEPVMNSVVRTWFSALIYQALHSSSFFDYCPNHPGILMRVRNDGRRMRCSQQGCTFYFCNNCKKWHRPGACEKFELPPGYRMCPGCHRPVEKTEACNRLTCRCGKSFCYYCGWGPANTAQEVYDHLQSAHAGYFNDPPDYRKFYLNQSVPDAELNDFYRKYPQLKPEFYHLPPG